MRFKKIPLLLIILIPAITLIAVFSKFHPQQPPPLTTPNLNTKPTVVNQKVKYPQDFTFVLVGDSMTATLGNSDELRMYMKKYYYNKSFEFLNYGFGSTNILSVEQRLTQKTQYYREYRPILDIDFDLILIE